ncbi:MAG: outer membrane receptor for ferrienterochelin and colicins [Patiriisocius sp.]|jgi:outer membrane receptor for ferrienterochelin and colicins
MKHILYLFIFAPLCLLSQEKVTGTILELQNTTEVALPFANVFWLNSQIGAVTDFDGNFSIEYTPQYSELVISYVGYTTDTISITNPNTAIKHVLRSKGTLDEVVITSRIKATSRSYLQAENVINISSAELLKAACCNLSESFETNPSIDVNFADAITGTRQIRMLGLATPYTVITTENIPSVRGASQAYGLSFIPGTWVESIQITKGAGSVVNSFESIAGQINTELVKPSTDDKLFVNAYGAIGGRQEVNVHLNTKVTDTWSTGIYAHGNTRVKKNDRNDDGFLDNPLVKQLNVMNRWQYANPKTGFVSFISLNYLKDDKQVGQTGFVPDTDRGTTNSWGGEIDTERAGVTAKLGYVYPSMPYQSLGLQVAVNRHKQNSYFGLRDYNIQHDSGYVSGIFNSIIGDSRHTYKTGITAAYDDYKELVETTNYDRTEQSLGAFFEYSFDDLENLTMTAGLRVDTHNLLGTFVTPRFHARYTPWNKAALRASFGRGKRSATIFTENQSLFATSRAISITDNGGPIYGLEAEIAWNYGLSFLQGFTVFDRKAEVSIDFYRTDFQNQVVVDWEDSNQIRFYNAENATTANSLQIDLSYAILERLDFRTTYKYYDVQTDYAIGRLTRPLTPEHRFFANLSYETQRYKEAQWKFDATYNWLSSQRFPSTQNNAASFRLPENSPSLGTLNAQITKVFSSKFEIYVGAENITDERQDNPILGAENPFGSNFDTTFVYGPIFGSNYYAGLRYNIN